MKAGARATRSLTCLGLAAVLVAAVAFVPATAAEPTTETPAAHASRHQTTIAPGVTYQRIINKKIPLRTYVLRFDPKGNSMLDVAKAGPTMPASVSTVSMLKEHHAIAGINGDFLSFGRGSPMHAFAEDGDLLQTSTQLKSPKDRVLAIGDKGFPMHVGETTTDITAHNASAGTTWPVSHWNPGGPYSGYHLAAGEVDGFTAYGGGEVKPPKDACSARLVNATAPHWSDVAETGITRTYTVDEVACSSDRMPLNDGIVLSAQNSGIGFDQINALHAGGSVDITWSMTGWRGVTDVIGGNALIVDNGVNTISPSCSSYLCHRNARAGVGITSDGTVLIVVVDGKVHGSEGVSLFKFGELMKDLGAVDVVNLDGDGSSTMVVKGNTVNHPGDPGRKVSSALAIIKPPDPGQHIGPAA